MNKRKNTVAERNRAALETGTAERELLTVEDVAVRYKLKNGPNARVWLQRHGVQKWNQVGRRLLFDRRDVEAAFLGLL